MDEVEEAKILRRRVGYLPDDLLSLTDEEAADLFAQGRRRYEDDESVSVRAAIIYLEGLLVNTAKMNTYRKNNTQENLSDVYGHVRNLIDYYREDLLAVQNAAAGTEGSVRSGKPKHVSGRYREVGVIYPWDM
jgi:hypothetical protein